MDITVIREIDPKADVSAEARIGPYCTIGPDVSIDAGTIVKDRVTIVGRTKIGVNNVIDHGSVLGTFPQDLKYRGRPTYLIIGNGNRLGPNVTAHVGTELGGYITRIGNNNVIETGAHIAHDCYVDDKTYLAPAVLLAGHIRIETGAVLEEMVGVHHFTTIGRFSKVSARTAVTRDVPPFTHFGSRREDPFLPAVILGAYREGIQNADLQEQDREALYKAIEELFNDGSPIRIKISRILSQNGVSDAVKDLCEFCLESLSGKYGRQREAFRGKIPPEAREYLHLIDKESCEQ